MRTCKQGLEINETTGRCVKVCKTGSSRNPTTGRCKRTKECKEGRELNPITGRCVKGCKKGSERNPTTGKCAKKTVPIIPSPVYTTRSRVRIEYSHDESKNENICSITEDGLKDFLTSEIFKPGKYTDDEIDGIDGDFKQSDLSFYQKITRDSRRKGLDNCEYVKKLFPPTFVNRIGMILGTGAFGTVFSNIEKTGQITAIKIESYNPLLLKKELRISDKLYKLGVSAQLMEHTTFKIKDSGFRSHNFLKMEKVDGILSGMMIHKDWDDDEIYELVLRLFEMIKIMSDNNISHGDMHFSNIGYMIDVSGSIELKLIDLGQSREFSRPMIDIIMLITFNHEFNDGVLRETFDRYARDFSKSMFDLEFPEFDVENDDIDFDTVDKLDAMSDVEFSRR